MDGSRRLCCPSPGFNCRLRRDEEAIGAALAARPEGKTTLAFFQTRLGKAAGGEAPSRSAARRRGVCSPRGGGDGAERCSREQEAPHPRLQPTRYFPARTFGFSYY